MLTEDIKKEIIENLCTIDPEKVILFGSFAYGTPHPDSDIDLYIVTKEEFIPRSFEEDLKIKKKVYQALGNFRRKYASDIIVHTLASHKKFILSGSSFSKEIMSRGISLI